MRVVKRVIVELISQGSMAFLCFHGKLNKGMVVVKNLKKVIS